MEKNLISVKNLSFSYKKKPILKNISFDLNSSQIICIEGENGSGKSTLLKCLCKLKRFKGSITYKKGIKIFYLPQENILIEDLSVRDNLILLIDGWKEFEKDSMYFDLDMESIMKMKVSSLSGGTKKKVQLFICFCQKYDLVILDEPFVGLDKDMRNYFLQKMDLIKKNETGIIFTTHIKEMTAISDLKYNLKDGEIFLQ